MNGSRANISKKLQGKDVLSNRNRTQAAERAENGKCAVSVLVTLTFDLDLQTLRARDQSRLPSEFGANPSSGSRDISFIHKHKTQTDGAKNRTFRSSLRAVKISRKR